MKLDGDLPRFGQRTASATSHNAPLARRNQGLILVRSLIRINAAAVKSRRLSQAKTRYVTVVGRREPKSIDTAGACRSEEDRRMGAARRAGRIPLPR
jgi:hypothetical protein